MHNILGFYIVSFLFCYLVTDQKKKKQLCLVHTDSVSWNEHILFVFLENSDLELLVCFL